MIGLDVMEERGTSVSLPFYFFFLALLGGFVKRITVRYKF
jgi:hypothetical protein